MVGGYLAFGLLGFQLRPRDGSSLADPAAAAALTFAFREDFAHSPDWYDVEGTSAHGWLTRQAFVRGALEATDGVPYSGQVLKVGWPFTMVRGFVRVVGEDVRREGVLVIRGDPRAGPVRLLPIQPVWPGMIINSLWLAAVLLTMAGLGRRLARARRSPA
jgi:hypothetical protein